MTDEQWKNAKRGTSIALGSSKSRRVSMPMCWIGLNPRAEDINRESMRSCGANADLGEVGQITGFARAERSASASRWPPSAPAGRQPQLDQRLPRYPPTVALPVQGLHHPNRKSTFTPLGLVPDPSSFAQIEVFRDVLTSIEHPIKCLGFHTTRFFSRARLTEISRTLSPRRRFRGKNAETLFAAQFLMQSAIPFRPAPMPGFPIPRYFVRAF